MLITKDEIAVIEKAADLLDGWLKNLISDNFGEMGCFIPLHAYYETHIVKALDILIQKIPVLGESVKRECDDLLKKAQSLSSIGEQHSSEYQRKLSDLSLLARRIIPRFRGLYRIGDILTLEKKTIIQAVGRYQEANPDRAGMPPKDLEDKAKLEFAQLKPPLEKLMKDDFIEAVDLSEHRPEHHIRRRLPQEVDEQVVKTAFESNYRFRLTSEGLKLYEQLPKATHRKQRRIIGWIFKNTSHLICTIIIAIIATIIATIIVDILADFGWIERIKHLFTR